MRRNERARMVLDGMELGLAQGRTPEGALISIAESRDSCFGVRFYLLAEHLRAGKRLTEALAAVPRLLPPQVVAMLRAGERLGDVLLAAEQRWGRGRIVVFGDTSGFTNGILYGSHPYVAALMAALCDEEMRARLRSDDNTEQAEMGGTDGKGRCIS